MPSGTDEGVISSLLNGMQELFPLFPSLLNSFQELDIVRQGTKGRGPMGRDGHLS